MRKSLYTLVLALVPLPAILGAQMGRAAPIAPTTPAIPAASTTLPQLDHLLARPASELAEIVERYTADRAALGRRYEVDYSGTRRARMREFYQGWQEELRGLNFGRLRQDARVDYLLLDARIKYELELLRREEKEFAQMAALLPFAPRLMQLQENRRRMEAIESPRVAEMLAKTAKEIDSLKKVYERPQPRTDSAAAGGNAARQKGPVTPNGGGPRGTRRRPTPRRVIAPGRRRASRRSSPSALRRRSSRSARRSRTGTPTTRATIRRSPGGSPTPTSASTPP